MPVAYLEYVATSVQTEALDKKPRSTVSCYVLSLGALLCVLIAKKGPSCLHGSNTGLCASCKLTDRFQMLFFGESETICRQDQVVQESLKHLCLGRYL